MDNKKQIEIAERIQQKLLERWEKILDDESASAAEVAVMTKMLRDSGWTLDPTRIPQGLKDKLTDKVDPTEFDDWEKDILKLA